MKRLVVGLDGDREARVGLGVFVGAVDPHVVGQARRRAERSPELLRRALEHLAAAQREQRVAAEQRLLLAERVGDVAAGVARHEEDLGLRFAEPVAVAVVDLDVDAGMRARSTRGPTMVQPVAFLISRFPPTWSP